MRDISTVSMSYDHITEIKKISDLSFSIPWSIESLEKELNNNHAKYIVAKLGDTVIGYGGLWLILDEAHITNIAIHPDYRRHGIADIILDTLIDICKANSIEGITLEVRNSNMAAISLYKKHGFIVEGIRKNYYDNPKEDGYIMWKRNIQ